MFELVTDTIRFLIGFVHIMAASTWFAGSLVSLNISTLTKLNKNFDQIFQYFIQWTNTIISTLVLTGVILILDSLADIGSKLYVSILTFKLLLFMWISIILYLNKYKLNYFMSFLHKCKARVSSVKRDSHIFHAGKRRLKYVVFYREITEEKRLEFQRY